MRVSEHLVDAVVLRRVVSTSTAYPTALLVPAQLPRTAARDSQRGSTDERIGLHVHSVKRSPCLHRSATCDGQYIPHP